MGFQSFSNQSECMKFRLIIVYILFFSGIHNGFSQVSKPMSEKIKTIAAKYNKSLLGENTYVFDPSMDMEEIQLLIDSIHSGLTFPAYEFSKDRFALLFKPGTYKLDVKVGYYTHVIGLGNSPEDVTIIGAVRSNSSDGNHVLCNFWRSAENLTIIPTVDSTNTWAVSQAAPLRRIHVKGNLKLFEGASSGGFMADCKIEGSVISGSQQQWFTRNSVFNKWDGGVWNMVYLGVENAPMEAWPETPVTTIKETPEIREKPYWVYIKGKYSLKIPTLKKNSVGIDWENKNNKEKTVPINDFYIAKSDIDNATSINNALKKGKHILFTPGIYSLSESLNVTRPGTVIMGIGMATLVPKNGNKVIDVEDVEDVTIASLLIDAATVHSETLMQVGKSDSKKNQVSKPTFLYDVFFRVGGVHEGSASRCLVINSNNVIVDHAWLWRADHGNGVGWDKNKCANGLIVNGNDVTIYGLFNEHFQEYQTIWNGENGRVYFYQCELPYDPPTNEAWEHDGISGYASYKVGSHVKNHQAWGLGIYGFFDVPLLVDQVIETPEAVEGHFYHKVLIMLGWNKKTDTIIKSIINGKGGVLDTNNRKQMME